MKKSNLYFKKLSGMRHTEYQRRGTNSKIISSKIFIVTPKATCHITQQFQFFNSFNLLKNSEGLSKVINVSCQLFHNS